MKNLITFIILALIVVSCSNNTNQENQKLDTLSSDLKIEKTDLDTVELKQEKPDLVKDINPANITLDSLLTFNSFEELEKFFGSENVKKSKGYYPEGMGEYNNVLLYPDTKNQVEFIWENDSACSGLSSIVVSGKNTDWKTKEGITVGTTLKELEKLNKGPFTFLGFDWDYSGATIFNDGYLNERKISVNLEYLNGVITDDELNSLIGDVTIDSKSEIAQKLNPVVGILTMSRSKK